MPNTQNIPANIIKNGSTLLLAITCLGWSSLASAAQKIEFSHPINYDHWITDKDVQPDQASGTVAFKLFVGKDGNTTSCEITKSSNNDALDEYTCKLLISRAKFTPATLGGRPVESTYFNKVNWDSKSEGLPFYVVARNVVIEFDVDSDGAITNCSVDGAKMSDEESFCRLYKRVVIPASERARQNVHVKQTTRVEIEPR